MNKKYLIPAVALATFGVIAGCSSNSDDFSSPVSAGDKQVPSEGIAVVNVQDAKAHMALYRRSVVDSRQFDASTSEELENASVTIDSTLENGNIAVNADVTVKDDSTYTVASAGVDGDGAAWIVQVEDGAVVYSWRDKADGEWKKFVTDKVCDKNKLNNIRVEHAESVVVIVVNGKIEGAFRNGTEISVKGKITIGFDKKESGKCHCKNGKIDQIDVEVVKDIKDTVESVVDTSATCKTSPKGCGDVDVEKGDSLKLDKAWIAEWDFNDSANVGLDATGNGHNATVTEGAVSAVEGIAAFDGQSGFSVKLDSKIKINDFVVEARVKPTQFSTMQNILVAEPPGRGVDGWILRIDEGVLTVHLRDANKSGDDWKAFPGKAMALDKWSEIRLERSADSVKLFQDGELTVAAAYTGDLTQMAYDWSIGYDGMQQAFHDRYFVGEMDYVRFGKLGSFTEGSVTEKAEQPLVAWEFNEPKFVGLDRMANNSTKYLVGKPEVVDTTVVLDGKSGLVVPLSKTFKRNAFAVEARVKPTKFGEMQNIIVAEPPGRYGTGWIVRLDNGVLTVHFRDEDVDGTEWNLYKGDKLALDEWTKIRIERTADSIKVFQNDNLAVKAAAKGDVSALGYDIGIGYDAMMQAKHNRFFVGEIDYIRYYGL